MSIRYKQAIQIGSRVTSTVFDLPCVLGCHKTGSGSPAQVVWHLFGDTEARHIRWGETVTAYPGDWLCEDYDGRWHLLTDEEYQETIKND